MNVTCESDNLLEFDRAWPPGSSQFLSRIPSQSNFSDVTANRIIQASLEDWVESPSRSLLRALGRTPSPGHPIFDNLLNQTRFLVSLKTILAECGLNNLLRLIPATREGRPVRVAMDNDGLTLPDPADPIVNDAIRCLYAYAAEQNAILAPSGRPRLHRGVRIQDICASIGMRASDILGLDAELSTHFSSASRPDRVYENMALAIIRREIGLNLLTSKPFSHLSKHSVLSFTSRKRTAEYFSDARGFVVSLAPSTPDFFIVASHMGEKTLKRKDPVSLRDEALTILKIPTDFVLSGNKIIDHNFEYFLATNDSRAINCLNSPYTGITYLIRGEKVTKTVSYVRQNRRQAFFSIGQDYPVSSREFARKYGFSPTPTEKSIREISIVSTFKTAPYSLSRRSCERISEELIERLRHLAKSALIQRGLIP